MPNVRNDDAAQNCFYRIFSRGLFVFVFSLIWTVSSFGQARHVSLVLVNLNEHQPVPNQPLLFYAGRTPRRVRQHLAPIKLLTDSRGRTSVELEPGMRWFQVWVDGSSVCSKPPDRRMVYDSSVLLDEGVVVSNTCSPALLRLAPDYYPVHPVIP
jgi:hypothetical protein